MSDNPGTSALGVGIALGAGVGAALGVAMDNMALGMAIGIGWYVIAIIASVYAVIVPRIPHIRKWQESQQDE